MYGCVTGEQAAECRLVSDPHYLVSYFGEGRAQD